MLNGPQADAQLHQEPVAGPSNQSPLLSGQLKRKIEARTPSPAPKKIIRAMKRDQEVMLANEPRRDNKEEDLPGLLLWEEEARRYCPHCQRLRQETNKLQD